MKLANKILGTNGSQFRYELKREPFTQSIEVDTAVITRKGFLVELTKGPPNEGMPQTDNTNSATQPNLVWSMFFIKGADPREKWTGDFAAGSSPDELFLSISSGTSFGVFRVNPHQTVSRAPDRVGKGSLAEAGSAGTWLVRPSAEMLVNMPQIDQIHLSVEGEMLVIDVVSPERRVKQYRFSLRDKQWK